MKKKLVSALTVDELEALIMRCVKKASVEKIRGNVLNLQQPGLFQTDFDQWMQAVQPGEYIKKDLYHDFRSKSTRYMTLRIFRSRIIAYAAHHGLTVTERKTNGRQMIKIQ